MLAAETRNNPWLGPATSRVPMQIGDQPGYLAPDQRVVFHQVGWGDYEALLAMRGESAVPRISYLEGEMELMAPSSNHEMQKKTLARLIEAYADAVGLDLLGVGSWTLKQEAKKRGLEPDECYLLGPLPVRADQPDLAAVLERPDIAIEVIWTHGGLDKLRIYHGLGVPEVWVWRDASMEFHLLGHDGYHRAERSRLWPAFDPDLIVPLMRHGSQMQAARALREALRDQAEAGG